MVVEPAAAGAAAPLSVDPSAGGVGAAGVAAAGAVVVPEPDSPPWPRVIPRNSTSDAAAIEFSSISSEAVSAWSGTALPSTTRRP